MVGIDLRVLHFRVEFHLADFRRRDIAVRLIPAQARIYVDGAYAGTAQQLGSFPLKPGSHQIELRDATGQTMYNQQINVILGKTLKIKV